MSGPFERGKANENHGMAMNLVRFPDREEKVV
jgi:hypothetical protein